MQASICPISLVAVVYKKDEAVGKHEDRHHFLPTPSPDLSFHTPFQHPSTAPVADRQTADEADKMVVRGVQQVDESQTKETVLDHLVNAIRTADRSSRSRIAGGVQTVLLRHGVRK